MFNIIIFFISFLVITLAKANTINFVAIGDLPYGDPVKTYPIYQALISKINKIKPEFSIHVGDIKSGNSLCSDKELLAQLYHFSMFDSALIYTPGDNEWTDCHRLSAGSYDPLERLKFIRRNFFLPDKSLGKNPISLIQQSKIHKNYTKFIENSMWLHKNILFSTVHIVGSNNNFESREFNATKEFFERDEANIKWINEFFDYAIKNQVKAMVISMHADIFLSKNNWTDFPNNSGFKKSVGETMLRLSNSVSIPILIIHGDSHRFKFDQPFSSKGEKILNVSRLVVPGARDIRSVLVKINTDREKPFSVELISPNN